MEKKDLKKTSACFVLKLVLIFTLILFFSSQILASSLNIEMGRVSYPATQKNIGADKECLVSVSGSGPNPNYGVSLSCSYNPTTGYVSIGGWSGLSYASCSYLCSVNNPFTCKTCQADYPLPQCATNVTNDCGGRLINCSIGSPYDNTECLNPSLSDCSTDETDCNLSCSAGWGNCNSETVNWSDGCEVYLLTNTSNCGSCDNICNIGVPCVNGVCGSSNYFVNFLGEKVTTIDLHDYVRLVSSDSPDYTLVEDGSDIETLNENIWKSNRLSSIGYDVVSTNFNVDAADLLKVTSPEKDSQMKVEIISPRCGANFTVEQTIIINISARDPDDIITGNITIDGSSYLFDNIYSPVIEINHQLEHSGNIQLLVTANNSRGERFKGISNIMVADPFGDPIQYYVAACIDSPPFYYIDNDGLIFFNASSTGAVRYTAASETFEAFKKSSLKFTWRFFNKKTGELGGCSGYGYQPCSSLDKISTVIEFWRAFPTINENSASLSVSIPDECIGVDDCLIFP